MFTNVRSAVRIGIACQTEYGPEMNLERATGIYRTMNVEEFANATEVRNRTAECIREDFRQGRTLTVDGWVISRTEAALCTLAATTLLS